MKSRKLKRWSTIYRRNRGIDPEVRMMVMFVFVLLLGISSISTLKVANKLNFKIFPSDLNRKSISAGVCALGLLVFAPLSSRAVDPAQLLKFTQPGQEKRLYGEGELSEKLKKLKETQDALDAADLPFIDLPSGVSYRQYRDGKGIKVVQPGSEVAAQLSIRCKSFRTVKEPGGVQYFSTAKDTNGNDLIWTIGSGTLLPGLEEGMMGMRRGSIRRVEVPSTQVFKAFKQNQLPLPDKNNADGNRRLQNLFKTDATLFFEVSVSKISNPSQPLESQ